MRLIDRLLALLAVAGLLGLGAWVFLHMPQIEDRVETRLSELAREQLSRADIGWAQLEAEGQRVTVTGTAPSQDRAREAILRVERAAGAGGLVFGGITRVVDRQDIAPSVSPYVFTAERTDTGQVSLRGYVPDQLARAKIRAALETNGNVQIDDQLEIAAGTPDENWLEVALGALGHLAALEFGTVRLDDQQVTVSGLARDAPQRETVLDALSSLPVPYQGAWDIRGPGLWSARHVPEGLMLRGLVASEALRDEIATIADTSYQGEVINEMRVSSDLPEGWEQGVRIGLPHFAGFRAGRMSFSPDAGGFLFEGDAPGSTIAFLTEDMAEFEGAFPASFEVREIAAALDEVDNINFEADPKQGCQTAFASVLQSNTVNFASGKAEITRDSGATLDKLMAVARRCSGTLDFELGGHTDAAGDRAFNVYLSAQRAQAVADYMAARGLARERLKVIGYGPDQPIASNQTAAGRAANRRIEFKVLERSEQ